MDIHSASVEIFDYIIKAAGAAAIVWPLTKHGKIWARKQAGRFVTWATNKDIAPVKDSITEVHDELAAHIANAEVHVKKEPDHPLQEVA